MASPALLETLEDDDFCRAREWIKRQPSLREQISAGLASYPKSCLYDDECRQHPDPQEQRRLFQEFLRDVKNTLGASPRAQRLEELTAMFRALHDSVLAELYIELGLEKDTAAFAVAEAVAAVHPGRLHAQWQVAQAAAEKPSQLQAQEEKIRAGLARKAAATGLELREDELEVKLKAIREAEEERRSQHRKRAADLKAALLDDRDYQRWQRVQELWQASGAQELWEGYEELDRAQGEGRRSSGRDFEGADARLAAAVTVELLRSRRDSLKEQRFFFLRNCEWRDRRSRNCGEVDVVVLASRTETQAPSVIALIEMKSGWFELPTALLLQQNSKLKEAASGAFSLYSGSSLLRLHSDVEVIAATLIPPHRFVIGLDPYHLRVLCQKLFGDLDLADVDTCGALHTSLRADESLKPRLAISPLGVFNGDLKERVLVLGGETRSQQ